MWKDFDVSIDHAWPPLIFEQIDCLNISWSATLYWNNVSRKDIYSNQLDVHLYSLDIWMCIGIALLVLFQVSIDWFSSWSYNTKQIVDDTQFCEDHYTWYTLILVLGMKMLYIPISSNFYIAGCPDSYSYLK